MWKNLFTGYSTHNCKFGGVYLPHLTPLLTPLINSPKLTHSDTETPKHRDKLSHSHTEIEDKIQTLRTNIFRHKSKTHLSSTNITNG